MKRTTTARRRTAGAGKVRAHVRNPRTLGRRHSAVVNPGAFKRDWGSVAYGLWRPFEPTYGEFWFLQDARGLTYHPRGTDAPGMKFASEEEAQAKADQLNAGMPGDSGLYPDEEAALDRMLEGVSEAEKARLADEWRRLKGTPRTVLDTQHMNRWLAKRLGVELRTAPKGHILRGARIPNPGVVKRFLGGASNPFPPREKAQVGQMELVEVAEFYQDQFEPGEPGYAQAGDLHWTLVDAYPVNRLHGFTPQFVQQMTNEMASGGREFNFPVNWYEVRQSYGDSVVVHERHGVGYVWEGNHRIAVAISRGAKTVPALVGTHKVGNPGAFRRFLGGAFNRPGWILPFPEFVEKVRAEMVRRGQHGGGPLEPEMVDALRTLYDEAAEAYRHGGPDAVDAALRGVRRNPTPEQEAAYQEAVKELKAARVELYRHRGELHNRDERAMSPEWQARTKQLYEAERAAGRRVDRAKSPIVDEILRRNPGNDLFAWTAPVGGPDMYADRPVLHPGDPVDIWSGYAWRSGGVVKDVFEVSDSASVEFPPSGRQRKSRLGFYKLYAIRPADVAGAATRNPLDLATIVGVGVLAGATQAIAQPWVTKHVYGVDGETVDNPHKYSFIPWNYAAGTMAEGITKFGRGMTAKQATNNNLDLDDAGSPVRWIPMWPDKLPGWPYTTTQGPDPSMWAEWAAGQVDAPPEPVMGMVGNPAGNARFYADQDDWPLQGGRQWWAVYDSVTREKMNLKGRGQRPVYGSERLAQAAADKLNKDWAAGRIEVVAENPRKEAQVTDRALRYRANATPPPGPRRCSFCGSTRTVEVGHINGHEEDNAPANLLWTCRPCNVRCGNTMRRAGIGRLTRQYNPDAKGAQSLGQWIMAINSMKGIQGEMTVPAAVAMIRATPPEDRADFQAEAWRKRRRLYGKSGRRDAVPF